MKNKKLEYREFYEIHPTFGAVNCDLEVSQYGVGLDWFMQLHGRSFMARIVDSLTGHDVRILDVGCGQGSILSRVYRNFDETVGIDISRTMAEQSMSKLKSVGTANFHVIIADAERLPFVDKTFDVVCATEIIEHVPNDERMLNEVLRVLAFGYSYAINAQCMGFVQALFLRFQLAKGELAQIVWGILGQSLRKSACKVFHLLSAEE